MRCIIPIRRIIYSQVSFYFIGETVFDKHGNGVLRAMKKYKYMQGILYLFLGSRIIQNNAEFYVASGHCQLIFIIFDLKLPRIEKAHCFHHLTFVFVCCNLPTSSSISMLAQCGGGQVPYLGN